MVRKKRFKESTLWKIFECLIDAATVLHTGNEFDIQVVEVEDNQQVKVVKKPVEGWESLVHLDIKLANGMAVLLRRKRLSNHHSNVWQ